VRYRVAEEAKKDRASIASCSLFQQFKTSLAECSIVNQIELLLEKQIAARSNFLATMKASLLLLDLLAICCLARGFRHQHVARRFLVQRHMRLDMQAMSSTSVSLSLVEGVNAWSVSGATLASSDFASSLFAASLLPYLVLLFFLSRPATTTPKLANFGFQFLLIFVFATIPAGIYAKTQYHEILANVDWLHGGAESLLTITNLLIILGFRQTRPRPSFTSPDVAPVLAETENMNGVSIFVPLLILASVSTSAFSFLHPEPSNALSIPTWAVHTSSLLEWLAAMKLIWEHSETSGNAKWKGMTWAMIPSHTSGICACTYHFFYNTPLIAWIVSLQAGLTLIGNSCMAFAAYRIYKEASTSTASTATQTPSQDSFKIIPKPLEDSDGSFLIDTFVKSIFLAVLVKYGELTIDVPFSPTPGQAAAAFIALPTLANIAKWTIRASADETAKENERPTSAF